MSKKDIGVIDMVDQPDGSAILSMDVEPEQVSAFVHSGLMYLIEQMRVYDKVSEVSPNTFKRSAREIYLSDREANVLFHFGVISALKRGIDESNKEAEEYRG